jgi:DNA-binding CsgD family transcriptional regulator
MARASAKTREKARELYLTGSMESNAEIARHLKLKPHTVATWRNLERWDELKLHIDRKAAEKMAEQIASDRVALNVRHYRFWDALLAQIADGIKNPKGFDVRSVERIASVLERAQKGQRLAKGLSLDGESEEAIRAQSQAEIRTLIDLFITALKEHVLDESVREQVALAVLTRIPEDAALRADEPSH